MIKNVTLYKRIIEASSLKIIAIILLILFLNIINAQAQFDYGTGAEGAFTAPAGISTLSGTHNYTNFTIPVGSTVNATGNAPLIIKCTGTATINGSLRADGSNGTMGTANYFSGTAGIGGAGGGGGWGTSGGTGGVGTGWGTNGGSFGTSDGAGKNPPGCDSNPNLGAGGGGGGYAEVGQQGLYGSQNNEVGIGVTGGAGGNIYGDVNLTTIMTSNSISTTLLGGSGGGGGGGRGSITVHGGGGGGGGGGAIRVTANSIVFGAGSVVSVKGGNGANGAQMSNASSGGGGGGSGGTINLQSNNISGFTLGVNSNITGGTGGTTFNASYGTGGKGSIGRILIEQSSTCNPPVITTQPESNITQCEGTNVTFTLSSEGTPTLSYQWSKAGSPILNATNSSYALNNMSVSDAAAYTCIVSNSCGNMTSNASTLTVKSKAIFTDTIPNLSKCQEENVTFSFNATGNNLSYQWTKGTIDIAGATSATYTISSLKPTDFDIYSCKVTNDCGTKALPKFVLTVISAPTSNVKFVKQTTYQGGNASYSVSPGGTSPFIFQWIKSGATLTGETNSIINLNNVACGDSGVYSCKISNSCSSITANISELIILDCYGRFKFAILGNVKYDNKDSTLMTNTDVNLLNMGDNIIDNTTTDANGYYVFVDLINDSYKLKCSTAKAWGGCNPTDALLVNKHYIGVKPITDPMKKKAADVNNDSKINPTDALMINRRYIGVLPKFIDKDKVAVPDWLFSDPTVAIAGLDITQNILAICTGDVNASYTPPKRDIGYELGTKNDKVIKVETGKPFDLPVYINDNVELGAMGIKLKVKSEKLKVIGINSNIDGLIYNITEDGVNIAWSAENEGIKISPDKPVLILKVIYKGDDNQTGIELKPESALADIDANYISIDKLMMPRIQLGVQSSEFEVLVYPNPFSSLTNINYTLPDDANVEINIYNVLGEKITCLTNERQAAGEHTLHFNASSLREGVYYSVLRLTNKDLRLSKTNILIITR